MGKDSPMWTHHEIPSSDLFILDLDSLIWHRPPSYGYNPSPRGFHSSIIFQRFLVIFGGCEDGEFNEGSNDMYALDLNTYKWCQLRQEGSVPSPRFGHKMVIHQSTSIGFLFGGAEDNGNMFSISFSDINYYFDESTNINENEGPSLIWNKLKTCCTPPLSRYYHTLDIICEKIYVFGGQTSQRFSDLYVYHLDQKKWSKPLYDGKINLRCHCTAVLFDKLIVVGGIKDKYSDQLSIMNTLQLKNSDSPIPALNIDQQKSEFNNKFFFLNVLEIKKTFSTSKYKFKLVTLGDSGVGKSCLLARFVQDVYADDYITTIGIDFKSIVTMIRGGLCTMQLWDTAGQERFGHVTGNYYRNADGFILVFDATRRESFIRIPTWVQQIKDHHSCDRNTTVFLLIGNKFDLKEQLCVAEDEARNMAAKINAFYISTSAKTAENVDAAFLLVAEKLVDMRNQRIQIPESSGPLDNETQEQKTGSINLDERKSRSLLGKTGTSKNNLPKSSCFGAGCNK